MNWVLETMIASTLLMAAVLALRGPVARMFGARVAYLLWLAPALRMILPPLPVEWLGAAAMPAPVTAFPDAMILMTGEIGRAHV